MSHRRGTRLDKLPSGNYRLIMFGEFSRAIQSQEINEIPQKDLVDMRDKIDKQLIWEIEETSAAIKAI